MHDSDETVDNVDWDWILDDKQKCTALVIEIIDTNLCSSLQECLLRDSNPSSLPVNLCSIELLLIHSSGHMAVECLFSACRFVLLFTCPKPVNGSLSGGDNDHH